MHQASTSHVAATDLSLPSGMHLSRVIYRSRALRPFSIADLHALTEASRQRNSREHITGVVLYDNERFYQWLEGPDLSIERVMQSIRQDPRHTDVEVLDRSASPVRSFAGWSMKLAAPQSSALGWLPDAIHPPLDMVENLHARPNDAATLLVKLVAVSARVVEEVPPKIGYRQSPEPVLRQVFLSAVVPELMRAGVVRFGQGQITEDARCRDLADSLVAGALDIVPAWLVPLRGEGNSLGHLAANLFEPVARRLGDLWADDICSEFDVTFALCRLQSLVRLLSAPCATHPAGAVKPRILIAPEPGELHRLGATLDRMILESTGWTPVSAYPDDDATLDEILSRGWFDVLDLSLSMAFRREQDLPRLARTIAEARRASRNPSMVVVVSGRIFAEQSGAAQRVGADAAHVSARGVNRTILRTLTSHQRPGGHMSPAPFWTQTELAGASRLVA
jgi:hypothetical protein